MSTETEPEQFSHATFLSPFTWRYGSKPMRKLWSEEHYRELWRELWVALADAQRAAGLVTDAEVADLRAHVHDIDLPRAHAIERKTRHDVMAEIRLFAEQATVGGGKIHLGATSADIEDNADVLRLRAALDLLVARTGAILGTLARQINRYASTVCMAYTHLQPAEPTTLGYRLAAYAQDFLLDFRLLRWVQEQLRGKGLKGAVGTSASYTMLMEGTGTPAAAIEQSVLQQFNLPAFDISGQTYPRKQDTLIINALAGLAQTAYRFAFDLRVLQSPAFGELSEPFGQQQVGSSAMPFKRNPRTSERVCSLCRYVMGLPPIIAGNAAHSLLERTLDDSASRRVVLPEAFLALDEALLATHHVLANLVVNQPAIDRNLRTYGPFAGTERLLLEWVRRYGFSRQALHEIIRDASLATWKVLQDGSETQPEQTLVALLSQAGMASGKVPGTSEHVQQEVAQLLDPRGHIGDAAERSTAFAALVLQEVRELAAEHPTEEPVF